MVSDHLQIGRTAFEYENHPHLPAGPELKVVSPETPNTKSAMQVGPTESVAQKRYGLSNLELSPGRQLPGLRSEARREFNP